MSETESELCELDLCCCARSCALPGRHPVYDCGAQGLLSWLLQLFRHAWIPTRARAKGFHFAFPACSVTVEISIVCFA